MRINYINGLRLIATLGVVFLHASAGILDLREIPSPTDKFMHTCFKYSMQFAVPIFVMISGALFLNPAKEIGYPLMLRKYVKRIALALLIFGLPMCLIETYFSNSGGGLTSIIHFITGHSWTHMWYLYMLIGLYLITPIIKPFVTQATDKDRIAALILMFVISSLFPTLNNMGAGLTSWMIISTPYIFIYMLGYWLCWKAPQGIVGNRSALTVVTLLCLAIIVAKCYYGFNYYGYADPVTICLAATLFLLFRSFNMNWKFANWIAPYCFGIYLVHNVFINFAYKFLKIETESVVPILNFIGFFLLFTLLSLASTYILMKIPFMRKYIL